MLIDFTLNSKEIPKIQIDYSVKIKKNGKNSIKLNIDSENKFYIEKKLKDIITKANGVSSIECEIKEKKPAYKQTRDYSCIGLIQMTKMKKPAYKMPPTIIKIKTIKEIFRAIRMFNRGTNPLKLIYQEN